MTIEKSARRRMVPGLALTLAVCLAAPVSAQDASPSPNASPGIEAVLAEALDEELVGLTTPEAISEAVREVVELDRERLAAIDPGLPDALDDLDAQAEADLASWLETVLPPPEPEGSPEPSPLPDASPVVSPTPEGRAGHAFLVARGPSLPDRERTFDQGGSYLSAVGQVAGMVSQLVGAAKPDKGSERDQGGSFVRGGTRFEIRSARVQDEVTVGITLSESYSIPSTTPGQPPIVVTDSGEATVIIDVCPDEDGTVVAHATTSATVDAAGNGLSYRVVADGDDRAVATVSPQANVSSVAHSGSMSRHATGDRAVFASGGEGDAESHLVGTAAWTSGPTGDPTSPTTIEVDVANGGNEADVRAWVLTRALAASLTDAAITAASRVWRGGRCLELKADPPGKTVEPGSRTEIKVTIHQKAHDDEVKRDVTATLAGTKEVSPLTPTKAPATFTYTATSASEGEGKITFKSVSNRGIAKELTETYKVESRLRLDVDGNVTFRQGPVSAKGTLKAQGLVVRIVPGDRPEDPPGVTVEGDAVAKITAQTPGCSGEGSKSYAVDAARDKSARLVGGDEDRRLAILLRPTRPNDVIRIRVRCEGRGLTMKFPLGSFWPNFTSGGQVEIPIGGGQRELRANVQGVRSVFTFKLRDEARR